MISYDESEFLVSAPVTVVDEREVSLDDIRPAAANDRIYRPINPDDPALLDLADDIRRNGLLEPPTVTSDMVLVSGHRRYAACRLVGLRAVRARVVGVRSTDPEFPRLLTSYNRQRLKTADELIREEVVRTDPGDAHRVLEEYRARASSVPIETMPLVGRMRRSEISPAKHPMLRAIDRVLAANRAFWPLSDRQIHYQLLNDPPLTHASKPGSVYRNDQKSYKSLCELLTRARLAGRVPFSAIADPTRDVTTWDTHHGVATYIRQELDDFLKGYSRDLMRSQPAHVEIIGEKNTVASIIRPVAARYTIPFTIGRGYCSLPPRVAMAERYRRSGKDTLVIMFLSDFDPEGENIPHSFGRSMRDDFELDGVEVVKVALTAAHVRQFGLQPQLTAKAGSSRRSGFVAANGEDVFELEAIRPTDLQRLLDESIRGVIDIDLFNQEEQAERADAVQIAALRKLVCAEASRANWDMAD